MSNKTFIQKLIVCILAGLLGLWTIHTLEKFLIKWIALNVLNLIEFSFLIISIGFAFFWHIREKSKQLNSENVIAFWQGLIIYIISFSLISFGLMKLLHLHITSSLVWMDKPSSSLSDEALMEVFFIREPLFLLLIGCLEIIGSILIIYRRTRMLGIFILLPVLLNIILMNIFYNVGMGATIQAILLAIGLFYILMQDYESILLFFFKTKSNVVSLNFKNKTLKYIIQFSIILLPLLILIPNYNYNKHPDLIGKYVVQKLVVNKVNIELQPCKDSLLSLVYFDLNEDVVFYYNNFKNIKVGSIKFNDKTRQLEALWRFPKNFHDTLFATLSNLDQANKMTLSGTMGKDTLMVELFKVN
jgi:hypothetical protein